MVTVRATSRGYFGGELREVGDRFEVHDDLWKDEKRRPKWAKLAAFGGKGDHDGDGNTGGSKQKEGEGDKKLADMTVPELRALAEERRVDLGGATKKADIVKVLEGGDTVQAPAAAPFADAPAPTTVPKGGIQEAIGGAEPDWLPPSDDKPVPADD